ncbi:MAG TPA: hypothetical protein VIP70_03860 [Nitrososphaeraceae archaeon]
MRERQTCEHIKNLHGSILPKTAGYKECEKQGTEWVVLLLSLICGHASYCHSSVGLHATEHYKARGHSAMIALSD